MEYMQCVQPECSMLLISTHLHNNLPLKKPTQARVIWEEGLQCLHQIAYKQVCGVFS